MTICAALSTGLSAQSIYPGQHAGKMKKVTTAPIQVESFDLKDVRLLPSRFRDNMMRDSVWMTSIATNRLLHGFRNNAGVFAGREGGYMTVKKLGGWESLDCELRSNRAGGIAIDYANIALLEYKRGQTEQAVKTVETALEYAKAFGEGELYSQLKKQLSKIRE